MNPAPEQETEIVRASQTLKILSVETRLRILVLLRDRDLCVGALACRLGLTQGAVSQHLKVLRDAGLVSAERDGYYVHYRVDEGALVRCRDGIDGLFARLRLAPAEEGEGSALPAQCGKEKEEPCARRKRRVDVRRAAM